MSAAGLASTELQRLRWQCRRGLLELDLLLKWFVEHRYAALSEPEQEALRSLLAQPDPTLLAWVQGQEAPPDELKCIIEKLVQSIVY